MNLVWFSYKPLELCKLCSSSIKNIFSCFAFTSSVIRQKGESQNGGNARAYQEVRNVRFSKNLACFGFLLPPF